VKNIKKLTIGFIFIGVLVHLPFFQTLISEPLGSHNIVQVKASGFWDLTGTPIFINGSATGVGAYNWSWFENQPWYGGGDGNLNTPYIIENITIDGLGTGNCIEIVDSEEHFIIRNCTVYSAGSEASNAGINFYNVTNGKVIDNQCSNNLRQGIILMLSDNNTIFDNIANFNDYYGIGVYSSHLNNISDNTIRNNEGRGIDAIRSHYNKLLNNIISSNWGSGIYLSQCNHSTFSDNIINENGWINGMNGITAWGSSHNIYASNIINYNLGSGIEFDTDMNNTFVDNEIVGNHIVGLYLRNTKDNFIANNSVEYNDWGVFFSQGDNNEIIENSASYNTYEGIKLLNGCENNTILSNDVNYNYENGIDLDNNCDMNNLTSNSINYNHLNGIYLRTSDNNNIIENKLFGNNDSIYEVNCAGNIFIDNTFTIILKLFIDVRTQIFTSDAFNITFFFHNENDYGVSVDTLQMWWNGTDVSSSVQNLGGGEYFVSLTPITVLPGDPPIVLNMTIKVSGFEDKYFEIDIAVDPESIDKEGNGEPEPEIPIISGYYSYLILFSIFITALFLIKKRKKQL